MAPASLFFVFLLQFCTIIFNTCNANKDLSAVPAILVFGDSTLDTGNNNYIPTLFKGNHQPYGIDFPGHIPTGRFSDGKLVPDFLVSMLGIKETLPPFLHPNLPDDELRTGVSFASAGSGYDELTTAISGVISMTKQLEYFKDYVERLKKMVGEEEAQEIICGSLVIISAGTNDFVFNFYDLPTRKLRFNISEYQDFLLYKLQNFVKELYDLGCRIFFVSGLPPVGCVPLQMTAKSPLLRRCIDNENSDSQLYNDKLAKLLPNMEEALQEAIILYADVYTPVMDMLNNPEKYGFVETRRVCCGSGVLEAGPLCSQHTLVCPNPSQHLFFDSIHPTETAYKYLAEYLIYLGFHHLDMLMHTDCPPCLTGFVETRRGCCGSGVLEAGPLCSQHTLVCPNPSQHLFFDSIHPTETAYKYLAEYLVKNLLLKVSDIGSRIS